MSGDLLTVSIKSPKNTTIFHDVLVQSETIQWCSRLWICWEYNFLFKTNIIIYGYPALRFVRGIGDAMYIHLDTDEANAACIGNATNYTLYQQIGKEKLR